MDITKTLQRINDSCRHIQDSGLSDIDRDILMDDIKALYLWVKGTSTAVQHVVKVPELTVDQPISIEDLIPKRKTEPKPETKPEPPVVELSEMPDVMEAPAVQTPVVEEAPKAKAKFAISMEEYDDPYENMARKTPHQDAGSSINEVMAKEDISLNDSLSVSNAQPGINDKAAMQDLRALIDLNKQHILVNELFAGNTVAFTKAIDEINDCATIEDAFNYIRMTLLPTYKWRSEAQSTRLFDKLVRQKFGVL